MPIIKNNIEHKPHGIAKIYKGANLIMDFTSTGGGFPDGLLHWFKADSNDNDELGTITATSSNVSYITGVDGNAFDFSASGAKVDLNSNPIGSLSEWSIDFYFYNDSNASNQGIYGNWTGNKVILVRKSGYNIQCYINTSTGQKGGTFFSKAADNTWYHVVFTYNGTLKCYLDTVISPSSYIGGTMDSATTGTETIGAAGTVYYGAHKIDNFRIWNKALTQAEIDVL